LKNYGYVNKIVLTDPDLSIQAKSVYSLLCVYADKNRKCYPSIKTLCNNLNKSRTQIFLYIKELKNKNYIIKIKNVFILV